MFLGYFDDAKGKSVPDKIAEAVEHYRSKFGCNPDLVLVNRKDLVEVQGLTLRAVEYVQPNHFWIGREEG